MPTPERHLSEAVEDIAFTASPAPNGAILEPSQPPALAGGGGAGSAGEVHRLGPIATATALAALTGHLGITVTADWHDARDGVAEYYVWTGSWADQDGTAPGRFWIPALVLSADLDQIIGEVHAEKQAKNLHATRAEAVRSVRDFHTGIRKARIAYSIAAAAEIDHMPRDEQERRYAELSAATGLRWTLQNFSGGKSIHTYISFDRLLDPDDQIREEIQRLLVVCIEGDTRITDRGRLLRLPGYDGPDRKQPLIHLDDSAHYSPELICDRLTAYAASLGILNVEEAYTTLQTAEQLEWRAGKIAGEAAFEMLEHAQLLRDTRANPAPADLSLAFAMMGRGDQHTAVHQIGGGGHVGGQQTGKSFRVDHAVLEPFRHLQRLTRLAAPCCTKSGAANTMHQPGDKPAIYCFHCKHMVVGSVDTVAATKAIDSILAVEMLSPTSKVSPTRKASSAPPVRRFDPALRNFTPEELARENPAPDVRKGGACTALAVASGWAPLFRQKWRLAGVVPQGNCAKIHQMLVAGDGRRLARDLACKNLACLLCGPRLLAAKGGALAYVPLTDTDGQPVAGSELAARSSLYCCVIESNRMRSWVQQFRRMSLLGRKQMSLSPLSTSHQLHFPDAYVAFARGGRFVVISTIAVQCRRAVRYREIRQPHIGHAVMRLTLQTYRPVLSGQDLTTFAELDLSQDTVKGTVVEGSVSTSRNVCGNPDDIIREAMRAKNGSDWKVEATHILPSAKCQTRFAILKLRHNFITGTTPHDPDEDATMGSVQSLDPLTDEQARELLAACSDEEWVPGQAKSDLIGVKVGDRERLDDEIYILLAGDD